MKPENPVKEAPSFFCTTDFCIRPDAVPGDLQEENIIQLPTAEPVNDQGESQ
jgi:hypothetical protein